MKIDGCGGCGGCQDFINDEKCPQNAFCMKTTNGKGYGCAEIDKNVCINCGLCLQQIDCLCEAIQED